MDIKIILVGIISLSAIVGIIYVFAKMVKRLGVVKGLLGALIILVFLVLAVRYSIRNWSLWFASSTTQLETSSGETFRVPTSALVDVKVNGSDDPVKLKAPVTYSVRWVIDPKLSGSNCSLTGYSEELVRFISGSGEISVEVVNGGVSYYYTVECMLNNQREFDVVQVNIE